MNTTNNLDVSIDINDGNEAIRPMNDVAQVFARIAGTKTLTRKTLALAKLLGYTVTIVVSTEAVAL